MDLLAQVISLTDFLHLPYGIEEGADQHKEWHHFCILGEGVRAILNLSLMRPADRIGTDGAFRPSSWTARVIMMTLEDDWDGDVDTIPGAQVKATRGRLDLMMGQNSVRFEDGCFQLSLALEKRPITLKVTLRPIAYPLTRRNTPIGKGKISWVVVPRLAATGTLVVDRHVYRLKDAPAYHDHNWGHWHWGDDFSWQWGFALPAELSSPWSVVFDRMTDRRRGKALELKLSIWKGAQLHRLFMHEEIDIHQEGFFTMQRLTKFPRPMALVAPELTTDVPRRFEVAAARRDDWLECRFSAGDLAQIIIPNETDLGVTIINEVSGKLELRGRAKGEPVHMDGEGFFEFLT